MKSFKELISGLEEARMFASHHEAESVKLTEAQVSTKKYSWGTMKTIHHGSDFSIPLHPEHHKEIAKLKDEQEHKFKTEDGKHWTARRKGDDVHFQGANNGGTTKVPHATMQEAYHSDTYGAVGSDPHAVSKSKGYGRPSAEMIERIKKLKAKEEKDRANGTGNYKKQTQSQRDAYVKNQMSALKHIGEDAELSENAPFKKLEHAVAYATDKVKTHRDNLDGIEVYKHSGGYDVNHTMNSSGRNSLNKTGAKHLGTVYKDKPTNIKESADNHYDNAQDHLSKANDADASGDKLAFHGHMADHHDSLSQWHESKGRSASADRHAEKADYHADKYAMQARGVKEDVTTGNPPVEKERWWEKAYKGIPSNGKTFKSITLAKKEKDKKDRMAEEYELDEAELSENTPFQDRESDDYSRRHTVVAHVSDNTGTPAGGEKRAVVKKALSVLAATPKHAEKAAHKHFSAKGYKVHKLSAVISKNAPAMQKEDLDEAREFASYDEAENAAKPGQKPKLNPATNKYNLVSEGSIPKGGLDVSKVAHAGDTPHEEDWTNVQKKKNIPFDGPYKSTFKKKNNPNRTGTDAARALAQRGMPKEETEGNPMKSYAEFVQDLQEIKLADLPSRKVTGTSYGAQYHDPEGDDDADNKKPAKAADAPKRGRGRPAGSMSGARQQGSAKQRKTGGVDYTGYKLHLPNNNK